MNVSPIPMRCILALWCGLWVCCLPGRLIAQAAVTYDRVMVVAGTTAEYSFFSGSIVYVPQISEQPQHGTAELEGGAHPNLGVPGNNVLRYTPDQGYYGLDTVAVDYWVLNPYGSADPADLILVFEVVPSVVTAQNDFATTAQNTPVLVDVLANDYTVGGALLRVASITLSNNGMAVLNADSTAVNFIPAADFTGLATFHYTICDDLGTCDVAVVNVRVEAAAPPLTDTLQLFTVKNKAQVVLLDTAGYQLSQVPTHGDLQSQNGELLYVPATDFTGADAFVFTKHTGQTQYTRTVLVQVFDAPAAQTFAFDDVAFTTSDTLVEVEVFRNDVGGATLEFVLGQAPQHGAVTYLGDGVFEYVPDGGFEGMDKFTYLAFPPGFNGAPEEATVYVLVSDFEPAASVFPLVTTKDKPLVVGYNIPVYNYSLEVTFSPQAGNVSYYPGWQTISLGGQTVEGYNMLVYTPDPGFTGNDSFAFTYCVSGNNGSCPVIQVDVEVKDIAVSAEQYCVNKHCVWAGDVNWDGRVDMADLLPIGLCMGQVGYARPSPDLDDWYGQYGQDWGLQLGLMGFDAKNVDTDGDGFVGASDTAAIATFYGNVHQPFAEPVPVIEGLQPYIVPLDAVVSPGDVLEAQIWLGTPEYPILDGYGLSFSLAYEPALFEEVSIDFGAATQSWLGYNSPLLYMTHEPAPGRLDAGITRTSGHSVHGYGIIGTASFIVVDDLPGFKIGGQAAKVPIRLEGGTFMFGNGVMGALPAAEAVVTLRWDDRPLRGLEMIDASYMKVYPNPASSVVDLHLNGVGNEFQRVQLYALTGQCLYDSGEVLAKHWQMDVSDLTPGVYVVRAVTTAGAVSKKLQVVR